MKILDWIKKHKKIVILSVLGGAVMVAGIGGGGKKVLEIVANIGSLLKGDPKPRLREIKKRWGNIISKVSLNTGVPEPLIASVIYQESVSAVSPEKIDTAKFIGRVEPTGRRCWGDNCRYDTLKGPEYAISYGLMQIIPYAIIGGKKEIWNYGGNPSDLFNPEVNISVGARKLKEGYDKYGSWPLAVAAFNAGPGAVSKAYKTYKWDWEKMISAKALPEVTINYLRRVFGKGGILQNANEVWLE
jgi:hypothetical protein